MYINVDIMFSCWRTFYMISIFNYVWRRSSLLWVSCVRRAIDKFKHLFRHRASTSVIWPPVDVPSVVNVHWRTCQTVSIFNYVWDFGVMRVQQLIVGWFKQAFHKMFAKQCRILHTSRIRKRRHKDPSYVRAPSVALVIVVAYLIRICRSGA